MAYEHIILDDPEAASHRRPLTHRPAYWAILACCGLLMAAILLSNPRIGGILQRDSEQPSSQSIPEKPQNDAASLPASGGSSAVASVKGWLGLGSSSNADDPVAKMQEATSGDASGGWFSRSPASDEASDEKSRPTVRKMPQDRTPVRRAGVSAKD